MNSHRRPVKNIEELRPVLYKYKFEEIKMEDLSINEKDKFTPKYQCVIGLTQLRFDKYVVFEAWKQSSRHKRSE